MDRKIEGIIQFRDKLPLEKYENYYIYESDLTAAPQNEQFSLFLLDTNKQSSMLW